MTRAMRRLTARERRVAGAAVAVVAVTVLLARGWPAWRAWHAELILERMRAEQVLAAMQRTDGAASRDDEGAFGAIVDSLTNDGGTGDGRAEGRALDAFAALTDSLGVELVGLRTERVGFGAVDACRTAVCAAVVPVRGEVVGTDREILAVVEWLESYVSSITPRHMRMSPMQAGPGSVRLRLELSGEVRAWTLPPGALR